jgi:hypothetical protein
VGTRKAMPVSFPLSSGMTYRVQVCNESMNIKRGKHFKATHAYKGSNLESLGCMYIWKVYTE